METIDSLLKKLWDDYSAINKQAEGIYKLLTSQGEKIVNDHIAFRTYNIKKIGVDALAQTFIRFGYLPKGEYTFKEKKLRARHYEHNNQSYPKIFISELKVEETSMQAQKLIAQMAEQIPEDAAKQWDFCVSGVPWKKLKHQDYQELLKESEYAAWMSAFGFRANHFTVFVNYLKQYSDLVKLNEFLKKNGYKLNSSGGEIKGSPKEYLEQSSTMAHPAEVEFADKKETIPACYYEFAKRYPLKDGKLFQGFIAQSADKIFESTNRK